MIDNTVQIVAQKNHEDNIAKLDIPEPILPYLNINAIQLIASKVSALTKQVFTYYGNLSSKEDSTIINLKSTEGNEVDITIRHDLSFDDEKSKAEENIIFDGLTKLLNKNIDLQDEFVESSDDPDAIIQEHKVSKEKLESILGNITEMTEKEKLETAERKRQEEIDNRKKLVMDKLGIVEYTEPEQVEPTNEKVEELSNILEGMEIEAVKETESIRQEKKEKADKMNEFLDALSNINQNDIKVTRDKIRTNRVKKYLDSLDGNT